jgi:DegT/DnrJ/EryC1/StrS aminotransferase family
MNINVTKAFLRQLAEYQNYMEAIWQRGWLTNHGPLVNELELRLKEYLGLDYLLFVSNGTIAPQIAIKALGLREEIITFQAAQPGGQVGLGSTSPGRRATGTRTRGCVRRTLCLQPPTWQDSRSCSITRGHWASASVHATPAWATIPLQFPGGPTSRMRCRGFERMGAEKSGSLLLLDNLTRRKQSDVGQHNAHARVDRYHSTVRRSPSSKDVVARKPNRRSARDVSRERRGWPSGIASFQRTSPRNSISRQISATRSRIRISKPEPQPC